MTYSHASSRFYSYTQWPGIVLVLTGCSGRVSPARSPLSCSGMRSSRLPAVSRPPRWRSGSTGPGSAAGSTSPSPHEVSYKKSIEISTDQATVVCFVACFTHVFFSPWPLEHSVVIVIWLWGTVLTGISPWPLEHSVVTVIWLWSTVLTDISPWPLEHSVVTVIWLWSTVLTGISPWPPVCFVTPGLPQLSGQLLLVRRYLHSTAPLRRRALGAGPNPPLLQK